MLQVKWNDEKMNLGISLIDEQHKKLLDLINRIIISIEENKQIKDIEKFVVEVLEYAKYHFTAEENLFKEHKIDTGKIADHKKEHNDFIDKATGIYTKLKNDEEIKNSYGIEILTDLYNYLTKWLIHHIVIEDKKIFGITK